MSTLQYSLLHRLFDGSACACDGSAFIGKSKLEVQLGRHFWNEIRDKVVLDFGCGEGEHAIEMAEKGAAFVYGIDIQEDRLTKARGLAHERGIRNVLFAKFTRQLADIILSLDSMEHFDDPVAILRLMASMLKPDGYVIACFGCPWFHPYGGHEFSVFPWAHLLFTEQALMRWHRGLHKDNAQKFAEIPGGLNQMTIRRFEKLIADSPFRFVSHECIPIRRTAKFHSHMTREFLTSFVRSRLAPKDSVNNVPSTNYILSDVS